MLLCPSCYQNRSAAKGLSKALERGEGIFTVLARVGEELAKSDVHKVLDLKLAAGNVFCNRSWEDECNPWKQHSGSAIVLELQYGFSWKSTLPSSHTDCFIRKKLGLGALRPASEESQGKLVCVSPGMCSVDGFPGSSSMHVRMLFPVVGPYA